VLIFSQLKRKRRHYSASAAKTKPLGRDLTPPEIAAILNNSLGVRGRFCVANRTLSYNLETTAV
jgi:hypothetical protein